MNLRDLIEMSVTTDGTAPAPSSPVRGKYDPTEADVLATVGDQKLLGAYQRKPERDDLLHIDAADMEYVYRVMKHHGGYATMGEIKAMVGVKVSSTVVRVSVDRLMKAGRVDAKWARPQGMRVANPPLAYRAT